MHTLFPLRSICFCTRNDPSILHACPGIMHCSLRAICKPIHPTTTTRTLATSCIRTSDPTVSHNGADIIPGLTQCLPHQRRKGGSPSFYHDHLHQLFVFKLQQHHSISRLNQPIQHCARAPRWLQHNKCLANVCFNNINRKKESVHTAWVSVCHCCGYSAVHTCVAQQASLTSIC